MRRDLLKQRKALSQAEVKSMSHSVVNLVRCLEEWQRAEEVLLYWPIKNEVDVRDLLQDAWNSGKKVFLPVCRMGEPGIMDFGVVRSEGDLQEGSFGLKEPCRSKCEFPDRVLPEVAIVPGVGFDNKGYRIGFGGGYYDRFLARTQKVGFLSVGVSYSFQLVEGFPIEGWDKAVRVVCTEKEAIWQK